jgi:hypothetical protein
MHLGTACANCDITAVPIGLGAKDLVRHQSFESQTEDVLESE